MGSTCSYIQVQPHESCASLISRCATTTEQFFQYNPGPSFCTTLAPQQPICCSEGILPDLGPQKHPDGIWASDSVRRSIDENWNTTDPQQAMRDLLNSVYDACIATRNLNSLATRTQSTDNSSMPDSGLALMFAQAGRFRGPLRAQCRQLGITI